jgi:hypothetical protein
MATTNQEVLIPGIVASSLLILTALGRAEVTMAVSAVMLVGMLVFHGRLDKEATWPKVAMVLCAAGMAAAVVLFMR